MIKIYDPKVAVIADIHFGLHSNSDQWHNIIMDYGVWLKSELDKKGIKDIFVLGDIFHDREEIGVKTLFTTEKFFQLFSDPVSPYNIVMITGNHDSYFRDNSDINSVSVFKGWNNIQVIDSAESVEYMGKTLMFSPWGADFTAFPDKIDILFGHLEINTFKKNVLKLCDDGIDSATLFTKADLVMSGHFHLRDERKYPDDKQIVYVGCPYPQSWNDFDDVKGYYILDLPTSKFEFTENAVSPRYHKIPLSQFFDKATLPTIKKLIPNNFIKIIVDQENFDYSKLEKLMNTLLLMKPMELSSDFVQEKVALSESYDSIHLDTKTMMTEFVEHLDLDNEDLQTKVIKELEEIYEKASNKVNIEQN